MELILQALDIFFSYLFKPFSFLPPSVALCIVSAATGIFLLKLFGIVSNQIKIKQAKDHVKAHFLAIVLYKHDIRISLKMQAKMLLANLKYLQNSLFPFIVLMILCIPMLGQLNVRYGYKAFAVGENINVFVTLDDKTLLNDISMRASHGINILTPPIRIKENKEIDWKVQALSPGIHRIEIDVAGTIYTKDIVAETSTGKLAPLRPKSFFSSILYPGEKLLPQQSKVESIKIAYPTETVQMFGYHFHWLLIFCVVSILSGLAVKGLFRVEI